MKSAGVALITGASGYLGSGLAAFLLKTEPALTVVEDAGCDFAALVSHNPAWIFHCAGRTNGTVEELEASNGALTNALFSALDSAGLKPRVVIPGSAAEYGTLSAGDNTGFTETASPRPLGPYGQSKLRQTEVAQAWAARGQDVVVGRIFNIIGPAIPPHMAVGAFVSQLQAIKAERRPARLEVGDLTGLRDYVDVQDVFVALRALATQGRAGEIYNICTGRPVAMGDLLQMLIAKSGLSVEVMSQGQDSRSGGTTASWGSFEKLRKEIGWKPSRTLKQSVEDLAARCFGD